MRAIPNAGPLWGVGLDPLAKLFVLRATAWQYGDEAPAGAIDIVHVLARAQLGVGDVEEVCPTRHGAQGVPGLDVGARVTGVAITAAKGDGDIAVGGHSEDEQELLEIGAVGLGVAKGDGRGGASADLAAQGAAVGAAEANRGAVVMKLVKLQGEALTDRQYHIGDERGSIGIE